MDTNLGQFTFRTAIKYSLIAVSVLIALSFVVFQARYLILGPQITITEAPGSPSNERQVYLSGTAHNISHLWLNGRPIYTDIQGNFKEALVLENSYTVITLRAEDRYGRATELTRTVVYTPSSFVK